LNLTEVLVIFIEKQEGEEGTQQRTVCPVSNSLFWLREIVLVASLILFCLLSPKNRSKSYSAKRSVKKTFFASTGGMLFGDSRVKGMSLVKLFKQANMSMNAIQLHSDC